MSLYNRERGLYPPVSSMERQMNIFTIQLLQWKLQGYWIINCPFIDSSQLHITDKESKRASKSQILYCWVSTWVRWFHVFIALCNIWVHSCEVKREGCRLRSDPKNRRVFRSCATGSQEVLWFLFPLFDFIRIFNKASGSGKQVAELRVPHCAYTNFPHTYFISQSQ